MAEDVSRANWNYLYEKGLIEILTDHKLDPRFKGQNGWNSDGWRSITSKFNEKFPLARFTKQQLQDKEKDLKASFKAICNARKESGVGWNEAIGMISAEQDLWDKCAKKFPKIKKHRKNGFPLYRSCEALYEGSIATGELSFTSTELPPPMRDPLAESLETQHNTALSAPEPIERSEFNAANQFSADVGGQEASEAQSAPPGSGRKRKQSQIAAVLDNFLDHKQKQTDETMLAFAEKKKNEEEYSFKKCIDVVNNMVELTKEEKAIAVEVFESDIHRQAFMLQTDIEVRLIWLRRKIRRLADI